MKKILKIIVVLLVTTLIILFVGNNAIRVAKNSGESIGIFEEMFLGKSIYSYLQAPWSENYQQWNTATEGGKIIADMITKYGISLIEDEALESIRLKAIEVSNSAYLNAKQIDLEYLRKSNIELPEMFSTKMIKALKLWGEGLDEKNADKILKGNQYYNEFLLWIQSKNRDDFNPMR
jgi:hypothetical protein